jgi:hypothetical protein
MSLERALDFLDAAECSASRSRECRPAPSSFVFRRDRDALPLPALFDRQMRLTLGGLGRCTSMSGGHRTDDRRTIERSGFGNTGPLHRCLPKRRGRPTCPSAFM